MSKTYIIKIVKLILTVLAIARLEVLFLPRWRRGCRHLLLLVLEGDLQLLSSSSSSSRLPRLKLLTADAFLADCLELSAQRRGGRRGCGG